jgi:hypothetical protein
VKYRIHIVDEKTPITMIKLLEEEIWEAAKFKRLRHKKLNGPKVEVGSHDPAMVMVAVQSAALCSHWQRWLVAAPKTQTWVGNQSVKLTQ